MIGDFGSSVIALTVPTSVTDSHGAPYYKAPERIVGDENFSLTVCFKSDIWSFGCLSYEVLTEQIPFKDRFESYEQLLGAFIRKKVKLQRPNRTHYNDRIWELVERCCSLSPSQRLTSEGIIQAFQDLQVGNNASVSDISDIPTISSARRDREYVEEYPRVYETLTAFFDSQTMKI
ncbi:Serine/threonine-protein kinase Nek6 [Leucoagaricus sp. SymC.cos]|nr:Serine/threonine-protein kinase Nek6 [Leucoagaricus sp. SymC.cos]